MNDLDELKNVPLKQAVNIIKDGVKGDISGLKSALENYGTVAKDVCEFYGISHEEYTEKIMGIGDTKIPEENGIEFASKQQEV